jgi:hypothetical protein
VQDPVSYDLGVFDISAAPVDRESFLKWYDERTEWADPRGRYDPERCTPALKAWSGIGSDALSLGTTGGKTESAPRRPTTP